MIPVPPFQIESLTYEAGRDVENKLNAYYASASPTHEMLADAIVSTVHSGWKLIQCGRLQKLDDDRIKYLLAFLIGRSFEKAIKAKREVTNDDRVAGHILIHAFTSLMFEECNRTLMREDILANIKEFHGMNRPNSEPSLN